MPFGAMSLANEQVARMVFPYRRIFELACFCPADILVEGDGQIAVMVSRIGL